jgi:hypothetical protein
MDQFHLKNKNKDKVKDNNKNKDKGKNLHCCEIGIPRDSLMCTQFR